ncbi:MAG: hypothetical protein HY705_04315 [Gemmatimonadetes bacterium]|nr:hypothetical protein [Gemmatimonadota bacterium]
MVDVRRELRVRMGIVERLREEYFVDGLRRWLDASRARKVLAERLPDQVPERHPPRPRGLGGPPVEIAWQQQLRSMHV